jgi:hypothetical protein
VIIETETYSPIEHLASIIAPPEVREETRLVMLTAAFDAGGDEGTSVLTVAGFVSSVKDWDDFSRLWTERLKREGIEYFRASEAAHFRKQFQPWRDKPERFEWRQKLSADLMKILKSHVYRKFGCTIIHKSFNTLSAENREYFHLRAYAVAGRNCDKQVREWAIQEKIRSPIALVFEEGDQGQTELTERLRADTGKTPIFKFKKDTLMPDGSIEPGFVPLQAGDWLAYEIQHATVQFEEDRLNHFRWPMEEFDRVLGEPTTYTAEDVEKFDKLLDASKEINKFVERLSRLKKP